MLGSPCYAFSLTGFRETENTGPLIRRGRFLQLELEGKRIRLQGGTEAHEDYSHYQLVLPRSESRAKAGQN